MEDTKIKLRDWIIKRNGKISELAFDEALLERKILTSLQVMDLILFVEKIGGKRISIEDLKPEVFRDINSIHANFFGAK